MDTHPAPPSSSTSTETLRELIAPHQVWMHLTLTQQHHLRQTLVLICQDLLRTTAHTQGAEVRHE